MLIYVSADVPEQIARSLGRLPLTRSPSPDVTHFLLPIPSFTAGGAYRGKEDPATILRMLPSGITVIGGFLDQPVLEGYRCWDFLADETYIAQNAAITAYGALELMLCNLPQVLPETEVLILGWGRIGKCLALLLRRMGVPVTVAARKETHRAMIRALGLRSTDYKDMTPEQYGVIVNTVPETVLPEAPKDPLKIELASRPGMGGENILQAGGLPGKLFPASSGRLIADTVLRYVNYCNQ